MTVFNGSGAIELPAVSIDLGFDHDHIWHPYSSMNAPGPLFAVASAEGALLTLEDGRQLVDGMASWWAAIHGYNVPELNQAFNISCRRWPTSCLAALPINRQ